MLENIFLKILNMSFIGSFVILFVMLIRLFLKKSPKIFSYLLWGVVLFRLLCPFSFESIFSLLPAKVENIADNITYSQSVSIPTPQIFGDITPPETAANGAVL
ncbi:MAG: M56 family metallopeptidase, partial [Oscillospiraceae bacterium]